MRFTNMCIQTIWEYREVIKEILGNFSQIKDFVNTDIF